MTVLEGLSAATGSLARSLWDWPLPGLLLLAGVLLALKTGLAPFRRPMTRIRAILIGDPAAGSAAGEITSGQALTLALGAGLGIRNFAGVATAIAAGGPGAVLWMWLVLPVVMVTQYAEAVLAVRHRTRLADGSVAGGPMFYAHRIKAYGAVLATLFAGLAGAAALLAPGALFQSHAIAAGIQRQFGVEPWTVAIGVATVGGLLIWGGVRRLARAVQVIVAVAIGLYCLGAIGVIAGNLPALPEAFLQMLQSALSPEAAFGGAAGVGVRQAAGLGLSYGAFSAQSGAGTAAIAHAAARTRSPESQAGIAMLGPLIDTVVIGALTALAICVSGADQDALFLGGGLSDANLAIHAFNAGLPAGMAGWGGMIAVLCSLALSFSALLAWSYLGQVSLQRLAGPKVVTPYRVMFLLASLAGALTPPPSAPLAGNLAEVALALMCGINLLALVALRRTLDGDARHAALAGMP